jgi:hypothetical protein
LLGDITRAFWWPAAIGAERGLDGVGLACLAEPLAADAAGRAVAGAVQHAAWHFYYHYPSRHQITDAAAGVSPIHREMAEAPWSLASREKIWWAMPEWAGPVRLSVLIRGLAIMRRSGMQHPSTRASSSGSSVP